MASPAALDHFFFKFQRDKTGEVRKILAEEIGFPLEVKFIVTQAGPGPKAATIQPGSLNAAVTELKKEAKLERRVVPHPARRLSPGRTVAVLRGGPARP